MSQPGVPDDLWEAIEPLLPREKPKPKGGRPRVPDRAAIDWRRASIDSLSVRAKKGGEQTGPNPVDRGKSGSKYHLLVDRRGTPLAAQLSAANAHDSTYLERTVDAIPPIFGPRGKPGR